MRTSPEVEPSAEIVIAAQRGDRMALDGLISAYLPLLYNIAGRAMNGHADVDDVVQETLLRAIRGLRDLRDPDAFRSWLVAIAIRQVRAFYQARALSLPDTVAPDGVPEADFADLTIMQLGLSASAARRPRPAAGWTRMTGICSPCGGRKHRAGWTARRSRPRWGSRPATRPSALRE